MLQWADANDLLRVGGAGGPGATVLVLPVPFRISTRRVAA